jgi:hypothetical protein
MMGKRSGSTRAKAGSKRDVVREVLAFAKREVILEVLASGVDPA